MTKHIPEREKVKEVQQIQKTLRNIYDKRESKESILDLEKEIYKVVKAYTDFRLYELGERR